MNNSFTVPQFSPDEMSQNLTWTFSFTYLFISLHSSRGEVFDFISQGCATQGGVNTLADSPSFKMHCGLDRCFGWSGFLGVWHTYFFIHSPHFSTFFLSPVLTVGLMKGDNGSWGGGGGREDIDSFFSSSLTPCALPQRCCFNALSFSHFDIIFSPPTSLLLSLLIHLFLCLHFLSSYFPLCTSHSRPHAPIHLFLFSFFPRPRRSGRDSQCSTVRSDRWSSGTAGFHRHLRPHCHHLVLRPTER